MTQNEASEWLDRLSREDQIRLLMEHYDLKQHLCAQTLGVPTGAPDWVRRAVMRGEQLRDCEAQLRSVLRQTTEIIEEATWRTKIRVCTNCMGTKTVGDSSCVICKGTGVRAI